MLRFTFSFLFLFATFAVPVGRGQSVNIDYEGGSGTPQSIHSSMLPMAAAVYWPYENRS